MVKRRLVEVEGMIRAADVHRLIVQLGSKKAAAEKLGISSARVGQIDGNYHRYWSRIRWWITKPD
jgi:hypothetical protein